METKTKIGKPREKYLNLNKGKNLFGELNCDKTVYKQKNHFIVYVLLTSLFILAVYTRFFAPKNVGEETSDWFRTQITLQSKKCFEIAKRIALTPSFLTSILVGFSVAIFTWMIIFFDSALPGKYPPSPLSPVKLRVQSGHNFHSGYTLALLNGFVCSLLIFWI